MTEFEHVPVMPDQVIEYLSPKPGRVYGDGTIGAGGHAELILESAPDTRVVGLDRDPAMLEIARQRLSRYGDRVRLIHASYEDIGEVLPDLNLEKIDGMLLDLGPSRDQLAGRTAGEGRGFSMWGDEEPLSMAYDPGQPRTARELLARLSERELKELFGQTLREGEVGSVVKSILKARESAPIETTAQLTALLREALAYRGPAVEKRMAAAYAAIRIAVNREIEVMKRGIDAAVEVLRTGARLIIISFHGLEHGAVRSHLRNLEGKRLGPPRLIGAPRSKGKLKVLTPRPLFPDEGEVAENPAARSARLHAAERL